MMRNVSVKRAMMTFRLAVKGTCWSMLTWILPAPTPTTDLEGFFLTFAA